ncbi:MAG: Na/Pi cotransporter family protein, partial [Methanomicrobiales archaeon]|nr:Na/Pi cotransporter family protein [Methanomicrobiales archaeon]
AANAKVRDLRKLAEQYSYQKRSESVSINGDSPLALRGPGTGGAGHRTPGVGAQEGRGDHDRGL